MSQFDACASYLAAPSKPVRTEKVNTMHSEVYQDANRGLIIGTSFWEKVPVKT